VQRKAPTGPIVAITLIVALMTSAACADSDAGDPPAAAPSATHSGHGAASPPPSPAPLRAGERFVNLTMPQAYQPVAPSGGTDEYRCFVVDPKLTSAAYLTGSQFLPQNTDIVHHAIFFRVSAENAAQTRTLDERSPGAGWQCFGDSGIEGDGAWVAHWAPGANEVLLASDLGYPMSPGSLLVMQVHYNLLATEGKPGGKDQSSVRLRLADGSSKRRPLDTYQVAAPVELPCTAEESGKLCDRDAAVADVIHRFGDEARSSVDELSTWCHKGKPTPGSTQHCDYPLEGPSTLYATAGHMHLLGRSIKMELNPGTPTARTLLDLPVYNFDEQAIRPLAEPVQVKRGDIIRVTCTHDAGLRKQLPALRDTPARYVVWGDGTSDEMCLGLAIASAE